ncbi:MAG: GEVED domain-containing protein [Ferruginibacter sp.]
MQTFTILRANSTSTNSKNARRNFSWILTGMVMILSLFVGNVYSQVSAYTFAASSGTYTALSSPTNIFTGTWDDNTPVSVPIGFSFNFNNTAYTSVFVNANGFISFGTTSTAGTPYTPISSSDAYAGAVAGWGHDMQAQPAAPAGTVDYLSSGGVFTVQWTNARRYDASVVQAERIEFQIKLIQATNQIQIVYGSWTNAILLGGSGDNATVGGQVGLRGASNADFKNLSVLAAGSWASPTAGGSNTASCYYNSVTPATKPASGQTYTFIPPPNCVAPVDQATSLAFGATTFSSIAGSFTAAASTPTGYLVVRYPAAAATTNPANSTIYSPGQALGLGTVVSAGTSTSFTATGLAASNTYDFYVYSYNSTTCFAGPVYNTTSPLTGSASTSSGTLSGTKTVGTGGDYDNLTLAFAAINTNGLSGNIDLQLIAGYPATAETYPIVGPTTAPAGGFVIKVYPTVSGLSITSTNGTGTLNLNNSNKVLIDGRVNQTGLKDLVISNTNNGASYAVSFNTDAVNNTIQYCTVASRNTSATSGTIIFAGGTVSGNDNNTIDNCDILDGGGGFPAVAIYSAGTSTAIDNSGNTISNSNIANYFSATAATAGVLLTGTGNSGWTINNNRLYQTANRTYTSANTHFGISIGTGAGYTITNNTIGFANSTGTGNYNMLGITTVGTGSFATFPSSYTLGTASTNATLFRAINASFTAGGTASSIQGNTIANIALLTSSSSSTAPGILGGIVVNSGNANIGNVAGNTLGATSGQGSIYAATTSTTSGGTVWGILAASANTTNIQNNVLGAIDAVGTSATTSGAIVGIDASGASNVTLNGNTIGNTTADNIRVGYILNGGALTNAGTGTGVLTSTSGTSSITGVRSTATGNVITLNSNTLRGWVASGTVTTITGVNASGSMTGTNPSINANTNLFGSATQDWIRYAFANSGTLLGVTVTNTNATTHSIQNNVFRGITNSVAGTQTQTYITITGATATNNIATINGNQFNALNVNTTGAITFISHNYSLAATGTTNINNNSIVTSFTRNSAGSVTITSTNAASSAGSILNETGNNFSNITVTGSSALIGINNTDGTTGTIKTITGNTLNNWSGTTGSITGMNISYINGISAISTNTITNLTGTGAITGIAINSSQNSGNPLTVASNTINNLVSTGTGGNVIGISCSNTTPVINITGHTIFNLSSTGASSSVTGIAIGGSTSTRVFKNKIYNLSASGATPLVTGIGVSSGTSAVVYNNYIGDLTAPAGSNGATDVVRGIGITSTTTSSAINVYFNTIRLAGAGGANFSSTGVFHTTSATATTATLNLRNNIIINLGTPSGTGVVSALRRSSATLTNYGSASNKNLLYAGTPSASRAIMYDGATPFFNFGPAATAGTYQNTVNPRDAFSFTGEAAFDYSAVSGPTQFFQSVTPSDPNYLHLLGGITTIVEGGADPIATPAITDDYDGDTRNATKPDVGADEFTGQSPVPTVTLNSVTPGTTGQCVATARLVSVNATTPSGTISTVTLNYTYNAVAQTPISMTNTTGTTWEGTIPAATSPANATVTWSVTVTNSIALTAVYTGTSYSDVVLANYPVIASATPSTICAGSPVVLNVNVPTPGSAAVGAGANTSATGTGTAAQVSPFLHYYGSVKSQYLVRASELTAAGIATGNITSLGVNVAAADGIAMTGLTISLAHTALTDQPATLITGLSQAYTGTMTPVAGLNTFTFSTPFNWDGTSNIIIQFCWGNSNSGDGSSAYTVLTDPTTYVSNAFYRTDGLDPAGSCSATTGNSSGTNNIRPKFTFGANVLGAAASASWSDGTNIVGTTNPLTVNPTTNTSYTATITALGCTKASNTVSVTTNPLPAAPGGNNSIQCGTAVPAAFVTSSGGGAGFKWYSAQTGGTLLQNGGGTYTSPISVTTHFWVSESNGTCESLRTEVIASVNAPDPVQASVDNNNVCANTNIQLTATVTNGTNGNVYSYAWTATPATGSGIPTSQVGGTGTFGTPASTSVTPTASGTYTYTVTGTDGTLGCVATSTVVVTVKPLPTIATTTATPSTICAGANVTLNGTSVGTAPGNATIGAGALTSTNSGNSSTTYISPFGHYYGGYKGEYLIRASELTAQNLVAGNITALSFDITTAGITYNGFEMKLGNTANTTAPTTFTTGLTSVFTGNLAVTSTGIKTITFTTPFAWDGTSNLVVQFYWSNNNGGGTAAEVKYDNTAYVSTAQYHVDSQTPAAVDGVATTTTVLGNGSGGTLSQRPKMIFAGQLSSNITNTLNWVWVPGSQAGSTTIVNPAVTTTYTVTATNPTTTCSTTATVTVTVNPLPPAPSAADGTGQCGTGFSDMSVSSNNVTDPQAPPFFKWYDAPSGGVLKQSGTSTTYTTPISATTTLYVSEVSANGCEGPRVMITSEVSSPDPITVTTNAVSNSICAGSSFDLSTSYTPEFNSFATFDLTATGGAASGITGTVSLTANSTGSDPYTIMPATAGTYTYTVTAVDPDKGCTSINTVVVTVHALPPVNSATATPATICAGASVQLKATAGNISATDITLGAGAITVSGTTTGQGNPFNHYYGGNKTQIIYTKAELNTAGLTAGNITALKLYLGALNTQTLTMSNFTISMGHTTQSTATATLITSGLTQVYSNAAQGVVVGTNTYALSTPFNWNNTDNIVISICWSNNNSGNSSASPTLIADVTAANQVSYIWADATAASVLLTASSNTSPGVGSTSQTNTTTNRPKLTFSGQGGTDITSSYTWVWNPGNINAGTTGIANVTPGTTTTYTATATDAFGCSANSSPVTVTVNPIPAAPSASSPVTRCGPGSVTLTATGGPGILHWYNVATGGTSLQTGGSYTTNVTGNISFWVAETSEFGCEGPRTEVQVTVTTPPTLVITPGGPTTFCQGGSVTLNGATGSDPSYVNFTWSAPAGAGLSSTSGASITATPTTSGTYTITLTADDNGTSGCANIATIVITMNPNPVISGVSATPATICAGGTSTLAAYGSGPATLPGTYCTADNTGGGGSNPLTSVIFGNINNSTPTQASPYNYTYPASGATTTSVFTGQTYSLSVVTTGTNSIVSVWIDWNRNGTYETSEWQQVWTSATSGSINILVPANATPGLTGMRVRSREAASSNGSGDACSTFFSGTTHNYSITVFGSANPSYTYTWNPGSLSGASVNVTPTSTTTYTLTATNPTTLCATTATPVTVTVAPVTANATATLTSICPGTAVTLNGTAGGGAPFTYSWDDGTTSIASGTIATTTVPPLVVNPTTTTSYTLTITDNCGNSATSGVTVTVNPTPSASIQETGPITLCSPSTQVLHAVTDAPAPTYQWTLNGVNIPSATGATYTISTVSTGTYRVIVTNTTTNCVSAVSAGVVVTINPQPSAVTITPPAATICNGSSQLLTASGGASGTSGNAQIGAGATTITGATTSLGSPYNHWYGGIKQQIIYTKAELNAVGINGGNINALSFELTALGSATLTMSGFTINIAHTTQSAATTTLITSGFTQVYSNASQGVTTGINNYVFTTPFNYNNTDNIVVSICWSNNNSGNSSAIPTIKVDDAPFTATNYIYADNTTVTALFNASSNTSSGVGSTSRTETTITRPKIVFAYNAVQTPSWSWAPATGLNATNTAAVTASPTTTTTTTYTATATNSFGCTNTGIATVTVNPRPTAVISGSGAFCQGVANTSTNLTITFTGTAPWNYTYSDGTTPVSGTTSSNPLTVTVAPNSATPGVVTYTVTALSDANCASIAADLTGSGTVTINPLAANPAASVVQPTCALGTGTINVTSPLGGGNTYSLDGINFQPSPSFPGQAPGTYTVYVNNSFGCFSPATVNVTVNPQPFVPGAPVITGTVNVCPFIGVAGAAGQLTYTATATGFGTQTFNWVVPTTNVTIVSGQGTGTLVLSFQNGFATQANKQLRLTVTNQCGTSTMTIYYLAAQIPNTPAPIVGPTDACPLLGGPAVAYTINKAPGAKEYLWSVPAGASFTRPNGVGVNDTTILVSFTAGYATGPITVQSSNDCGVSGIRSLTVTRIAPSQPNIISGPTNACPYITPNAAATYTVPAVPGVTYTWSGTNGAVMSSPQGSNTMSVSFPIGYTGGTISVTATTGCGTSAARNLAITTLNPATPSVPDIIQTHFCGEPGGRKFTYTLSSTPANATSVVWTVPAGATFINLTPISIEVTYPDAAVSGVVTVQAVNPCANSVIRSVNVKLPACPTSFAGTNNGTNGTAESKGGVAPVKASTPAPALAEALEVKIFPNPTVSDFKLEVLTSGTEEITVRVLDNLGRLYKNFKLMPNQIIALGAELKSGSYLVEVRQGKTVKTTKVIKF